MGSIRKPLRYLNVYEDELRMYNEARSIRRGNKRAGSPPKYFEEVFDYKQPRRNEKGCGDVKQIDTITGEVITVHCDEVTRTFRYKKPPRHNQYNLRYDKSEAD